MIRNLFRFSQRDLKRYLYLDILRGLAILMVVISHNPTYSQFRPFFYWPVEFFGESGWMGVDLFFVLSGYLVGGLLIKEIRNNGTLNTRRFIFRRAFKIWPVYYVFLTVFLITRPIIEKDLGSNYFDRIATLLGLHLPNFLHIQNYFPSTNRLGWLWSLGVEEHFYLVIPFIIGQYLKKKYTIDWKHWLKACSGLTFLIGLCLIFRHAALSENPTSQSVYKLVFPSHLRIDALATGVFLAYSKSYFTKTFEYLLKYKLAFLFLGLALICTPSQYPGEYQLFLYPFGLTILTAGFCFIVFSVSGSTRKIESLFHNTKPLLFRPLALCSMIIAFIGLRSYSIYVWHGFFAKPISNRICQLLQLDPQHIILGPIQELIYIAVPVTLGCLSYSLIEEPFLKLRERWVR